MLKSHPEGTSPSRLKMLERTRSNARRPHFHPTTIAIIRGAALCAALLCSGCTERGASPPASTSLPTDSSSQAPLHDTAEASPVSPGKSPLKEAIVSLLKQETKTFPAGTRLKSVDLKDGVASLDFSSEFNGLANMGESGESLAQKRLQATLAQFPTVEKMRVTVEGRPFDSQATDWNTPFSVRRTGARPSAPKSGGSGSEDHGVGRE
jgi:hypothetical protein